MTMPQTVPHGEDTAVQGELHMSFELGDKQWKPTLSDCRHGPSRYSVDAGDKEAVLNCTRKAKERLQRADDTAWCSS